MKKSEIQKKISGKVKENEWLSKLHDKFIRVDYLDLKLVPNQALLLGYIRGMIAVNSKRGDEMKKGKRVWMKDSMKKMAFLTGISESTVKDYIATLLDKQYIIKGNFSTENDNTNWYTVNQDKIISDHKAYLKKQIDELKSLEEELEIELTQNNITKLNGENDGIISQKSSIEPVEITETLLYNNIDSVYNILETDTITLEGNSGLEENHLTENEFIDDSKNENLKLDKISCFKEIDKIFPDGWYDYLLKKGIEETMFRYFDFLDNPNEDELSRIVICIERILE